MSEGVARTDLTGRNSVLLMAAFSFLIAELACTVYFVPPAPPDWSPTLALALSRAVMFGTACLTIVAVAKEAIPVPILRSKLVLVLAGLAMASRPFARFAFAELTPYNLVPQWLDITTRALWGIGFAIQLCVVAGAAVRQRRYSAESFAFVSFLFAGVVASIAVVSENSVGVYVKPLLAILSTAALMAVDYRQEEAIEPESESHGRGELAVEKSNYFILAIDGVLMGVVACHVMHSYLLGELSPVGAGLTFAFAAVIAHVLYKVNPMFLLRSRNQVILLPAVFLLLLAMNFAPAPVCHIAAVALLAVLLVFNYANLCTLILRGQLAPSDSTVLFARGRIAIVAGEAVGWLCGSPLSIEMGNMTMLVASVICFALICIQLSLAVLSHPDADNMTLVPKRDVKDGVPVEEGAARDAADACSNSAVDDAVTDEAVLVSEELREHQCHEVAQRYQLTKREEEVLFLLSRGRSARYIADDLVISEKTVKTHVNRIYRKIGTHSRQELIDIVESVR